MIGNLCDPDYEPTDEDLEWLAREMMVDVRLSQERIRQKLAKQIEDQIASLESPGDEKT